LVDLSWRRREPRGAISADLDFGEGRMLKVVATHLGLRPAERREQVERLLELFTWHEQERAVLMGDVNEWFLWGRPLKHLHRYFDRTRAVATFPARRPVLALDRLWTHPGSILRGLEAHATPLARVASDHLPLVASIEI
jgi:endonuclease/exonuclease/phosphatase family metal-dependent hydrolase